MPTYTQVQAQANASTEALKTIKTGIDRVIPLSGGYSMKVVFQVKNSTVDAKMIGPHSDINRIPYNVVIQYAQKLNLIRRWMQDLEPDFPSL